MATDSFDSGVCGDLITSSPNWTTAGGISDAGIVFTDSVFSLAGGVADRLGAPAWSTRAIRHATSTEDSCEFVLKAFAAGEADTEQFVSIRMSATSLGYNVCLSAYDNVADTFANITFNKDAVWVSGGGVMSSPVSSLIDHKIRLTLQSESPVVLYAYVDDVHEGTYTEATTDIPAGNPGIQWNSPSKLSYFDDFNDGAAGGGGDIPISVFKNSNQIIL